MQGRRICSWTSPYGAIALHADAVGHLGVADAGVAAVLALLGAGDARLDAALELFVGHFTLP